LYGVFVDVISNFSSASSSGDLVLIEERIYEEFQNFIFVDGTSHDKCPELLIAFVHFSYHKSEGKLVICDLQGAIDDNNNIHYSKQTTYCLFLSNMTWQIQYLTSGSLTEVLFRTFLHMLILWLIIL
jgi:hypothetical protein